MLYRGQNLPCERDVIRTRRAYTEAVSKHPDSTWPRDIIHMVAIMAEEAGEAIQAANDVVHGGKPVEPLMEELAQTAAMCFRCMEHIERIKEGKNG